MIKKLLIIAIIAAANLSIVSCSGSKEKAGEEGISLTRENAQAVYDKIRSGEAKETEYDFMLAYAENGYQSIYDLIKRLKDSGLPIGKINKQIQDKSREYVFMEPFVNEIDAANNQGLLNENQQAQYEKILIIMEKAQDTFKEIK